MSTRNPSLNIRPDIAKAAGLYKTGEDALLGPRGPSWWTGKHPTECPGFDPKDGVLRALPLPHTSSFTRQDVMDYFDNCWTLTEVLFCCLQGSDAFLRQPYHQLRHPMIFYYGHPAVLYVNKFRVAGLLDEGIDQFFEQLFETGVDEMSWDDLSRGRDDWPPISEVTVYRRKAYDIIKKVIMEHPSLDKKNVGWDDPAWAVFMGFEHERIHIETSSVLIRELPLDKVRKPEFWPEYHPTANQPSPALPAEGLDYPANDLIPVAGEEVVLGKPKDYPSFGWDNEYGSKTIAVQPFKASRFKVTNGEFLRFVKGGGYSNARYWSSEGWAWRTFRNVKWPTFWIPNGPQGLHKYQLRALFDAIDMRWDWPVDVNYHEAKAYCAWKSEQDQSPVKYRVITEAEHMLLRNSTERMDTPRVLARNTGEALSNIENNTERNPDLCMQVSGTDAPSKAHFNYQLAWSSQSPVTELAPTKAGFHDVMGNAWEWGEDHYAAFSGFKVHPYYEDFSSPCFGGKHQLIFGGSFISTGQLASKFARYQFRPHFFQHASFRVVAPEVDLSLYDTTRYGPQNPIVPFMELSCMDCAPPYVGEGPCCSCKRRGAFTPTLAEEQLSTEAKNKSTRVLYESDTLLAQVLNQETCQYTKLPTELFRAKFHTNNTHEVPHRASSTLKQALAPLSGNQSVDTYNASREWGSERSEVLATHYGPHSHVFAALAGESGILSTALHFHRRLADDAAAWAARVGRPQARALDLGCSVGRATFELARHFESAVGCDLSTRVIEVANKLKENKRFEYECRQEGEVTVRLSAVVDDGIDTSRATFVTEDACALPAAYHGSFDAVLAANLLDRVPDPQRVLQQARDALAPGGVLVLTSPFSWSEEYTDRANWLGGMFKDGAAVKSQDALTALLNSLDFELLAQEPCHPLLIADHARKFQLLITHKMVLQKRK